MPGMPISILRRLTRGSKRRVRSKPPPKGRAVIGSRSNQGVTKCHGASGHRNQSCPLRRLKIIGGRLEGAGRCEDTGHIASVVGRRHQQQVLREFGQPLDLAPEHLLYLAADRSCPDGRTGCRYAVSEQPGSERAR
jgi:hypothetical protein